MKRKSFNQLESYALATTTGLTILLGIWIFVILGSAMHLAASLVLAASAFLIYQLEK